MAKDCCAQTTFTSYIEAKADFGPCGNPTDEELVAAFHRLNDFLRCDPVLKCGYVTLELGGQGGD